jgi:hypothetical protein
MPIRVKCERRPVIQLTHQTGIFVLPRADEISGSSVHAELNGVRIFL